MFIKFYRNHLFLLIVLFPFELGIFWNLFKNVALLWRHPALFRQQLDVCVTYLETYLIKMFAWTIWTLLVCVST